MRQFSPRACASVCLIAENCLAEAYLRQLLCKHPELRVTELEEYMRLSPLRRSATIFIVDQCGLQTPLYECLRELRARCSNAKFLLLGREKSKDEIVRLLIMGVQGYIRHADVAQKLVQAIFALAANELWVPYDAFEEFLREAASALRKDAVDRQKATPREEQILELVRKRLSNREIAERLNIQVSTVKFHVSNILSKKQVDSRRRLVDSPSSLMWKPSSPDVKTHRKLWRGRNAIALFKQHAS